MTQAFKVSIHYLIYTLSGCVFVEKYGTFIVKLEIFFQL